MSFKGYDSNDSDANNKRVKEFHEKMTALDQKFLETIVANRQQWFDDDKKMSKETAEAIYDRLLRRSVKQRFNKTTKEPYPPHLEPKVNCRNGTFECVVENTKLEEYSHPINKISLRGTQGIGIISLTNFYIQQTSCGPTWTLLRLRADETASMTDFGFIDVDEDEEASKKTAAPKAAVQIDDDSDSDDEETKPAAGNAEDSSSEEEEEEPEPEPVPVVKKGKSTVTKKK